MPRRRRSADEARDEILDHAHGLLREGGPEAVRLQAIAARVGISHPGVLHHFGSRDGLLEALYRRWARAVRARALERLAEADRSPSGLPGALEEIVQALSAPRYAQLLAHLLAAQRDPFPDPQERGLGHVAELLHAERVAPTLEASRFLLLFGVAAVYGDALVGAALRERLGLGSDADTLHRYRRWAVRFLTRSLQTHTTTG